MSGRLNINVSGGAISLGAVVQGDGNTVHAQAGAAQVEGLFAESRTKLAALGQELERPPAEVAQLGEQLDKLKAAATAVQPEVSLGKSILKTIKENSSWAYPMVKDLLKVAWPAVLAALAG